VLTPTSIYHLSLTLERFVPWDVVVDMLAPEGRTPWITVKAMPTSGIREGRHTGRFGAFEAQFLPCLVVRAMRLGANVLGCQILFLAAEPAYRDRKRWPPRRF
jgi:hypothetical protein